jgi:hypothetical protein
MYVPRLVRKGGTHTQLSSRRVGVPIFDVVLGRDHWVFGHQHSTYMPRRWCLAVVLPRAAISLTNPVSDVVGEIERFANSYIPAVGCDSITTYSDCS